MKPANKAEQSATESGEPRAETEGNAGQQSTYWAQSQVNVSQALERIRRVAKERKKEKFTSLLHHISIDLLDEAFSELKQDAAPGIDGLTWRDYEQNLERNLEELHARVHRGAYRALPSRRTYIPRPDGRQRPLAIAALEDKIVQRATAAVLNAIYEEDFLGFSYGFRPGRSTHDALDALDVGINSTKVNWILDADIRSFFDEISQEWLVRFLEHRIGDRRIIRLIQKWLKVGVLEDGIVTVSDRGTGRGLGKPETFNFLGFTIICGKSRAGKFQLKRKTRRDRMRAKLRRVKEEMRRRMHQPIPVQGNWLHKLVKGYFNYHAVPTNFRALAAFRAAITKRWLRVLTRRSDTANLNWTRMNKLIDDWLPQPRILHPWPSQRFAPLHT